MTDDLHALLTFGFLCLRRQEAGYDYAAAAQDAKHLLEVAARVYPGQKQDVVEDEKTWYNTIEAARMLHQKPKTLAQWRCEGRGPAYTKIGNAVLYRKADLEALMQGKRVEPAKPPTADHPKFEREPKYLRRIAERARRDKGLS